MNTFNVNKRCIWTYEDFLKNRKKAEDAKHSEKGEADIVKKSMAGEKEGNKGVATLDESMKHIKLFEGLFLNESQWTRLADTDEQEEAIQNIEKWIKNMGKRIVGGTPMPEAPSPATTILDLTHNGSEIYISTDGVIEVGGDEVDDEESFKTAVEEVLKRNN